MPNCHNDTFCYHFLPLLLFVSARVSNELGAGRPQIARLAICIGLSMVVTEGSLVAAFMIFGRRVWGYCYSNEEKVVKYVGEMMLLVSVSHVFDGIQSILSGFCYPIINFSFSSIIYKVCLHFFCGK